jgi:hypothetical protein
MSNDRISSCLSRRSALAVMTGSVVAVAACGRRIASARQPAPTPVLAGDCTIEPGLQLLINWRLGMPVLTHQELLPPLDWKSASHPTLPLFLMIPPDWQMLAGWANSYTDSGMPIWQDSPPQVPELTLARVISPDATAAFDYAVGNIQGQPLAPQQVAVVAEQTTLGEKPRLRPICSYDDANPLAPSWFYAFHHLQSVLITSGTALGLPDVYLPATTVTFQNVYAPSEELESLMRTVFIPILTQFMAGGGSDDDDGGGGDDDNGDDDGDDDGEDDGEG